MSPCVILERMFLGLSFKHTLELTLGKRDVLETINQVEKAIFQSSCHLLERNCFSHLHVSQSLVSLVLCLHLFFMSHHSPVSQRYRLESVVFAA